MLVDAGEQRIGVVVEPRPVQLLPGARVLVPRLAGRVEQRIDALVHVVVVRVGHRASSRGGDGGWMRRR